MNKPIHTNRNAEPDDGSIGWQPAGSLRRAATSSAAGLLCLGFLFAGLLAGQEPADDETADYTEIPLPDAVDADRDRPDRQEVVRRIVERTNAFRDRHELAPVAVDDQLTTAAQEFADYMARTLKYGHRADGRTPAARATAADYEYCLVTENIAYAYRSGGFTSEALTDKFFVGWQESPEHRDNMLDKHATETGVAVAQHEDHPTYFAVQLFARPRSAAIEFTIINRTDRTFDYTLSTESEDDQPQEHSLPAGVARRHGQCLPTQLSIAGGNRTATPRHGATYEITSGDDGYKLSRVNGD